MTKADIISEISTKTGIEKVDVQETVEAFWRRKCLRKRIW